MLSITPTRLRRSMSSDWSLSFGERPVTICAYVEKRLAGYGMAASVDDERRVNKIGGQSVLRRISLLLGAFLLPSFEADHRGHRRSVDELDAGGSRLRPRFMQLPSGDAAPESSDASHLEGVIEPGCAAVVTTGLLLLRSGALTSTGASEYSITPDLSITNRGR